MKLALVTGGLRRIGAAIAARLAKEGFALALHAHEPSIRPDEALIEALAATGTQWQIFTAELGDEAATTGMLEQISQHFGELPDCLVNNASQFFEDQPSSATPASLISHFRINAAAPAVLALQLAASASVDRPLVVINILDQRISHPSGDQFSYTTSKLALAGLTGQLARALAPHVRVCAVAPGLTLATPDYDEPQLDRLRQMMPLQRLPTPADIAEAVAYLVNARATTGQTIFVDGGADLKSWDRDFVHLGR